MKNRRSYSGLMNKPVWAGCDRQGKLLITIRADTVWQARQLFTQHNRRNPTWRVDFDKIVKL